MRGAILGAEKQEENRERRRNVKGRSRRGGKLLHRRV